MADYITKAWFREGILEYRRWEDRHNFPTDEITFTSKSGNIYILHHGREPWVQVNYEEKILGDTGDDSDELFAKLCQLKLETIMDAVIPLDQDALPMTRTEMIVLLQCIEDSKAFDEYNSGAQYSDEFKEIRAILYDRLNQQVEPLSDLERQWIGTE